MVSILTWNTPSPHLIGCEMGEKNSNTAPAMEEMGEEALFLSHVSCLMFHVRQENRRWACVVNQHNPTPIANRKETNASTPRFVLFSVDVVSLLLIESPGGTLFRILDFKTEGCQLVTNLITRSPILIGLGLGTQFKQ